MLGRGHLGVGSQDSVIQEVVVVLRHVFRHLVILLLWLTASVPVLEWRIPNFSISFLLKVAGESKSLDDPASFASNKLLSSVLGIIYIY